MDLPSLIGSDILVTVPSITKRELLKVKLMTVEAGGIWIESQTLTNVILALADAPAAARTPVFFLPYSSIGYAMAFADSMALNERAFGVPD
jgi:hypothetical protein